MPSLRDRIPSRLRVSKGTSGSTVVQHDGQDGDGGDDDAHDGAAPVRDVVVSLPQPAAVAAAADVIPEPVALGAPEQLALLGAE